MGACECLNVMKPFSAVTWSWAGIWHAAVSMAWQHQHPRAGHHCAPADRGLQWGARAVGAASASRQDWPERSLLAKQTLSLLLQKSSQSLGQFLVLLTSLWAEAALPHQGAAFFSRGSFVHSTLDGLFRGLSEEAEEHSRESTKLLGLQDCISSHGSTELL